MTVLPHVDPVEGSDDDDERIQPHHRRMEEKEERRKETRDRATILTWTVTLTEADVARSRPSNPPDGPPTTCILSRKLRPLFSLFSGGRAASNAS